MNNISRRVCVSKNETRIVYVYVCVQTNILKLLVKKKREKNIRGLKEKTKVVLCCLYITSSNKENFWNKQEYILIVVLFYLYTFLNGVLFSKGDKGKKYFSHTQYICLY